MSIGLRRIGGYHVLGRIGVGGMAEVYFAERRGPGGFRRAVALKVLRPHLRDAAGVAERFTREARLAAGLRHPNLVPVIDFGVEDGLAYLAMDLVDGPDLRRAVLAGARADRPLPPRLAVHVAIQVARGLAYAHRHTDGHGRPLRLVHRDVSPQNVLLSCSGEVRLADFGIATAAWAAEESASGTLRGKLAYLAPEQVDGATPDARADVFALGVVLWELLAGRRLFLAATDAETLARVRRCEVPVPPAPELPGVPADVWGPLRAALARDREQRGSAERLAAGLAAAWPESDRGDAGAALAAWLAEAGACDPITVPPGSESDVRGSEMPGPAETPTLSATANAGWSAQNSGTPARLLGWSALVVVVLALVATAAFRGGPAAAPAPPPRTATPALPPAEARAPEPQLEPTRSTGGRTKRPAAASRSAAVIVTSNPAGAAIEVDGRPMGHTPRRLEGLEPERPVRLVLRLDGHRAAERSVTPSSRSTPPLDVVLEPAFGLLSLDAYPWAEVTIDGVPAGPTPVLRRAVPVGRRHVRFLHPPSGRSEELVLQVEPDGDVRQRVVLVPSERAAPRGSPREAERAR